jgi:ubiquinone/menaquinone biosynthesis C-methylase UbiE
MATDRAEGYRLGYSDEELERLEHQHRLWSDDNLRLLQRAGIGSGDTVVDIGCGPGFTTLDLARAVGPGGRVIAVDRDGARSLPLLQERARRANFSNVEVRMADLEEFDLPQASVDGVYGRWVLMYLPEAAARALAQRAAGWLEPGGACILSEFCNQRHAYVHPPITHMSEINDALVRGLAGDRGCNPQVGSMIPGWLAESGLQVELHVVTKVVRATRPEWRWAGAFYHGHLPPLVDEGLLREETLAAFFADWESRSDEAGALYFYPPVLESIGRRASR